MKNLFHVLFLLFSIYTITLPIAASDQPIDKKQQGVVSVININNASPRQIADGLKGIGLSKAKAIVAYRETNGPFKHAADLAAVKGIGDRTVERNRDRIRLK